VLFCFNNSMTPLQSYFKGIADDLDNQSRMTASVGTHRGDRGTNREAALLEVLKKHLPERLKAELGGQIIGLSGEESKQVDIIIQNDIAIRFKQFERNFVLAEGVAAVISVKSFLDKDAIYDCLDNFASIPQFDSKVISFPILKPGALEVFNMHYPRNFIFAFDGLDAKTLVKHVMDYYSLKPNTPANRLPKLIIVNRKHQINYSEDNAKTFDGQEIPAKSFYPSELFPEMHGYPFVFILHELSKFLTWLPHMQLDFNQYFLNSFSSNSSTKV
jgi:hypothetical protein